MFSLVPITSCTLITEVDRGLIDDNAPDASGGTAGTGGSSGTGGTAGSEDGPRSNDASELEEEETGDE